MAYVGNTPAEAYISISSQTFTTINGTGYVLSSSVTNSEDIALFLNNVRQKPSTYTATGTALTMGTATTTLDALYCVYLGKALQTVNPPAGSVGTASIADDAVTYAKIQDTTTANRVIGAATAGEVSEVQVVDDMTNFVSTASAPGLTVRGDGSTDGYLQLNCDQNSHGVKIKSPAHSAAQSYTLTLPGAAPAVNKFIETDGSGNLSFSSVDVTTDITGTVPTGNLGTGTADATTFLRGDQTYAAAGGGKVLQSVNVLSGALITATSNLFPEDDTIPQNTEGDEVMTLAITPVSATSKLHIFVNAFGSHSASPRQGIALFVDSDADAISFSDSASGGATTMMGVSLNYVVTSGSTSARTYKLRMAGMASSGTLSFNGQAGGRMFGTVTKSSMIITEIEA